MKYFLMLANATILISFGLLYRSLPPEIPIFYSLSWGERQLGSVWSLLLILLQIDLFYLVTSSIRRHYFKSDPFIGRIVAAANGTYIAIALVVYLKIILLVT